MPTPFSRTLRALEADRGRRYHGGLALGALVLLAWCGWFVFGRVAVYEVTDLARLEIDQQAHAVQATVGGRITAIHATMGQGVAAGDVLVEIDGTSASLVLEEEQARAEALANEAAALTERLRAAREALEQAERASEAAVDEGRSRLREAETRASHAEAESARAASLAESGVATAQELLRSSAKADEERAAADAARAAVERLDWDQRRDASDRRAEIAELEHALAKVEGERRAAEATVRRLAFDVDERSVRAPVAGRIAQVGALRAGTVLSAGDPVATIVPAGRVRVVGEFLPHDALGRLAPGQPARMRLDGFPWAQYGTVTATVVKVAGEARYGRVRVEMVVTPGTSAAIPLQHGLPGTVEVEVERVSPATLVLRAAGRLLGRVAP